MADEAPAQSPEAVQAILDAIQAASPSGGSSVTVPNATHAASNAQGLTPSESAVINSIRDTSPSSAPPPAQPNFLSRSFDTILGLPKQAGTWLTTPNDTINNTAAGVGRGVRDVADTITGLAARLPSRIPGVTIDPGAIDQANKADRDAWEKDHGDSNAAGLGRFGGQALATAGPVGAAGRLVAGGASMLPAAIGRAAQFLINATPATSTAGRVAQLAAQGAGLGAAQAGLTSGGYDEPTMDQIAQGALSGAAAGPVIGGLTRGVDAARGYIGGIRPDVADLANVARSYGVTPPVSAMTSNDKLKMALDALQKLPGTGADAGALVKQRQFQGALTNEMGSTADRFGPATMKEAATRLSDRYNNLYAASPPIEGGKPLTDATTDIAGDAAKFLVGDQEGAMAHVGNAMQKIHAAFQSGPLDPEAYKALMGANDGTLARIEDAAPSAAQPYLERMRDAVRDRFAASAGPDAAAELKDIDRQWRVMKTVQPLSAASTLGDIGPGGVLQRAINVSNQFDGSTNGIAYTGGGPLGDLGRVGKQFFGHIPDSGTAARLQGYDFAKHPIAATIAAIPGILAGRPLQMWNNSPTIAGRMIDTSLGGPRPDISRALPPGLLGLLDYERGQGP